MIKKPAGGVKWQLVDIKPIERMSDVVITVAVVASQIIRRKNRADAADVELVGSGIAYRIYTMAILVVRLNLQASSHPFLPHDLSHGVGVSRTTFVTLT